MAHKKGQSSSRNGRDSQPKMLGVKAFGGEFVTTGSIIIRQRGTKYRLFALADGTVKFSKPKRMVEVVPAEVAAE